MQFFLLIIFALITTTQCRNFQHTHQKRETNINSYDEAQSSENIEHDEDDESTDQPTEFDYDDSSNLMEDQNLPVSPTTNVPQDNNDDIQQSCSSLQSTLISVRRMINSIEPESETCNTLFDKVTMNNECNVTCVQPLTNSVLNFHGPAVDMSVKKIEAAGMSSNFGEMFNRNTSRVIGIFGITNIPSDDTIEDDNPVYEFKSVTINSVSEYQKSLGMDVQARVSIGLSVDSQLDISFSNVHIDTENYVHAMLQIRVGTKCKCVNLLQERYRPLFSWHLLRTVKSTDLVQCICYGFFINLICSQKIVGSRSETESKLVSELSARSGFYAANTNANAQYKSTGSKKTTETTIDVKSNCMLPVTPPVDISDVDRYIPEIIQYTNSGVLGCVLQLGVIPITTIFHSFGLQAPVLYPLHIPEHVSSFVLNTIKLLDTQIEYFNMRLTQVIKWSSCVKQDAIQEVTTEVLKFQTVIINIKKFMWEKLYNTSVNTVTLNLGVELKKFYEDNDTDPEMLRNKFDEKCKQGFSLFVLMEKLEPLGVSCLTTGNTADRLGRFLDKHDENFVFQLLLEKDYDRPVPSLSYFLSIDILRVVYKVAKVKLLVSTSDNSETVIRLYMKAQLVVPNFLRQVGALVLGYKRGQHVKLLNTKGESNPHFHNSALADLTNTFGNLKYSRSILEYSM